MTAPDSVGENDPAPAPRFAEYLRTIAGNLTQAEIAARTGFHQSHISRWLAGHTRPTAYSAIQLAHGLGSPPTEALLAAGYITQADLALPSADPRGIPTAALLAEVARRTSGAIPA